MLQAQLEHLARCHGYRRVEFHLWAAEVVGADAVADTQPLSAWQRLFWQRCSPNLPYQSPPQPAGAAAPVAEPTNRRHRSQKAVAVPERLGSKLMDYSQAARAAGEAAQVQGTARVRLPWQYP